MLWYKKHMPHSLRVSRQLQNLCDNLTHEKTSSTIRPTQPRSRPFVLEFARGKFGNPRDGLLSFSAARRFVIGVLVSEHSYWWKLRASDIKSG